MKVGQAQSLIDLQEYNQNHDQRGEFSSGNGGGAASAKVAQAMNVAKAVKNGTGVSRQDVSKAIPVLQAHASALSASGDHKGYSTVKGHIDRMQATLRNPSRNVTN